MTTPKQVYQQVLDLFADEDHWTAGASALNMAGDTVDPLSDEAVRWCASGAITKFRPEGLVHTDLIGPAGEYCPCPACDFELPIHRAGTKLYDNGSIITINDTHGLDAVRRVLEEAINEAE